jgi:hypothetical protein
MKILFFLLFVLISCSAKDNKIQHFNTSKIQNKSFETESLSLNNPAFFLGGNFLNYIQILSKKGFYNKIVEFSSRKIIDKYGKGGLLNYFKAYNFAPKIKFEAIKKTSKDNYIIYYTTIENATQISKNVEVVIENDSCKLQSLPN